MQRRKEVTVMRGNQWRNWNNSGDDNKYREQRWFNIMIIIVPRMDFNTWTEKVVKDTNFLENEQTVSMGQKDTVYTKKNWLRMTKSILVKWIKKKNSIRHPKQKNLSHLQARRGHLWKKQQTSFEKTGQAFFYHYLACDLEKVKEPPF